MLINKNGINLFKLNISLSITPNIGYKVKIIAAAIANIISALNFMFYYYCPHKK